MMTNSEIIDVLDDITLNGCGRYEKEVMIECRSAAISALEENDKLKAEIERLKSRNCQSCVNKEKCAIFDNFNIDYCSDWEKGGNNGNSKNL